jgi:indolepyruvate ferredoxin oxidoreductase alpha subunit
MEEILLQKSGKKIILLGNEAIVRGALEAGVNFVSSYPGTPASDIGNLFFALKEKGGPYFEWSTNEKVALEGAIGASFCGLKSLAVMKNFGLNVSIEALIPAMYTGVKGALVLVVADDVSCWSSAQSEQNSRAYSYLAHIPTLEPSDSQECKDLTKLAFEISERFKIPVMVRTTTRVAHQRMIVTLNQKSKIKNQKLKGEFIKEPERWVTMPPRVLEMKKELLAKIRKIKDLSEKSAINQIISQKSKVKSQIGIITSGISHLYIMEALNELKLNLPVLKIGFFYPLPENKIKTFIKKFKKVLIVEELEPYLEKEITRFAKEANPKLQIFGKNLIPEVGELKPEIVTQAIAKLTNKKFQSKILNLKSPILKRFPRLCPGCPYWLVISGVEKAVDKKEVIFGGDIGCYMLFGRPPLNFQDYLSCMGSSIGIAHGIMKATPHQKNGGGQKLITFIGDSTFFHAGIPALINTVFNKSNPLIIILENQTTAMTGHQPHPGRIIKIEDIVSTCGVKNLKVIDPGNQEEFIKWVRVFLEKDEVSVIVARRPCIFVK